MEIKQETMGRNEEATNSKAGYYDCIEKAQGKVCAAVNIPKNSPREYCVRMIRKIVACCMPDWTPEDVRDRLTPEIATGMGLWPIIKSLPCPDELDSKKDLRYVAWTVYPETKNMSEIELMQNLFKSVITGERKKFPKKYFYGINGMCRARKLLEFFMNRYAIPHFDLTCLQDAYELFASDEIAPFIEKCHLSAYVSEWFGIPLNFLHAGLGKCADDIAYYNMFFHRAKRATRSDFLLDSDRVLQLNGGTMPKEYEEYLEMQKKKVERMMKTKTKMQNKSICMRRSIPGSAER